MGRNTRERHRMKAMQRWKPGSLRRGKMTGEHKVSWERGGVSEYVGWDEGRG